MSGKDLFTTLTSYCSRKEYESQVETTKKSYAINFKDDYPLNIKNLFSTIGSFAFRSLVCQYNQMNFYTCKEIKDKEFIVERVQVSRKVSNKSFDDLKISYENMICFEIGIGESDVIQSRKHRVTLTSCSCQFNLSWGLPCRHMIRVHFHTNWLFWDKVTKHVINSQWLVKKRFRFLQVVLKVRDCQLLQSTILQQGKKNWMIGLRCWLSVPRKQRVVPNRQST